MIILILELLIGAYVLLFAIAIYVRFAPVDVAAYHVMPDRLAVGKYPAFGGFMAVRQIAAPPDLIWDTLFYIAQNTPRTVAVMGSVEEGLITFQTRPGWFGFLDHTTVALLPRQDGEGPLLKIHARRYFGAFDMGVNEERVQLWLSKLGPLTVAP